MELVAGGSIGQVAGQRREGKVTRCGATAMGIHDEGHAEYYKRAGRSRLVTGGMRRKEEEAKKGAHRGIEAHAGEEVEGIHAQRRCRSHGRRLGPRTDTRDGKWVLCRNGSGEGASRFDSVTCQGLGEAGECCSLENGNQGFFSRQFQYTPRRRIANHSNCTGPGCQAAVRLKGVAEELRQAESVLEHLHSKLGDRQLTSSTADVDRLSLITSNNTPKRIINEGGKCKRRRLSSRRYPQGGIADVSSSDSSSGSDSECDTPNKTNVGSAQALESDLRSLSIGNSIISANSLQTTPATQLDSVTPATPVMENPSQNHPQAQPCSSEVFVCQGKGCTKRGADNVLASIAELNGHSGISISGCKCMKLCGKGPILAIKSNGDLMHYKGVTSSSAVEFISKECLSEAES